ncbi:hypothetical protein GWI33_000138 [Rhynchophorus ferrugineus]|uniref:Uncharacterized protein n=1 Tax=Rhynchophorus ferrugineus TaxID=354439 RepID=A0A834J0P8_RHYFE|nr:hypothetical protein GWI33_000138 [Rhynchophorus ferrugineus]
MEVMHHGPMKVVPADQQLQQEEAVYPAARIFWAKTLVFTAMTACYDSRALFYQLDLGSNGGSLAEQCYATD